MEWLGLEETQMNIGRQRDAIAVGKLVLTYSTAAHMQAVCTMQIGDPPGAVNQPKLRMLARNLAIRERHIVIGQPPDAHTRTIQRDLPHAIRCLNFN